MTNAEFFTARRSAADALQGLSRALVAGIPTALLQGGGCDTNLLGNHVPIPSGVVSKVLKDFASEPHQSLAPRSFLFVRNLRFQVVAGSHGQQVTIAYTEADAEVGARLSISETAHFAQEQLDTLVNALHAEFNLQRHDVIALNATPAPERQVLRAYESALALLGTNVSQLGTTVIQQEQRLSEFLMEKTEALEQRYSEHRDSLESKHAERLRTLEERETALRLREEAIDARDRTTTRRDLLKKMREQLEQQRALSLSEGTVAKRSVITLTCVLVMLFSSSIIAYATWAIVSSGFEWHRAVPMSAAAALFASTLVFFLRWNDAWFRDHARAEFRARRTQADVLRASWVAELYFEWTETKDAAFPEVLAERLTQSLFTDDVDKAVAHPVEQAVNVLKGLRVKAGNVELEKK